MDQAQHPLSDEKGAEVGIAGADADGWIENTGTQPVASGALIDIKFVNGAVVSGHVAGCMSWHPPWNADEYPSFGLIGWWRPHRLTPDPRDEQIRQLREALEMSFEALNGAVAQLESCADCIETRRLDEALLHACARARVRIEAMNAAAEALQATERKA